MWSLLSSHLVGVFRGEVLHRRDDSLGDQLTVGGRSLLLDQLCFLTADWRKQAAGKMDTLRCIHTHTASTSHIQSFVVDFLCSYSSRCFCYDVRCFHFVAEYTLPGRMWEAHSLQRHPGSSCFSHHKERSTQCPGCVVRGSALCLRAAVWSCWQQPKPVVSKTNS